jgi:hypothetical protein
MNLYSRFLAVLLPMVVGVALVPSPPAAAASTITVKLSVGDKPLAGWYPDTYWVTAGTPVAAVVTGSEVYAELQRLTSLGLWVKVTGKDFTTEETARFAVPLNQRVTRPVKTQSWRILVRAGNYRAVMPQYFRLIGQPAAPPPDSLETRAVSLAEGRWDRFNPCTPVTWAMDIRRSPYGRTTTTQLVQSVISSLRSRTGLNFVYRGNVTHSGKHTDRSRFALTIVWAKLGRAGVSSVDHRWMRGADFFGLTKGTAVINTTKLSLTKTRAILFHEVMHVLGAGHSTSSADLMYLAAIRQKTYGAGDLAALKQVGASNTCF